MHCRRPRRQFLQFHWCQSCLNRRHRRQYLTERQEVLLDQIPSWQVSHRFRHYLLRRCLHFGLQRFCHRHRRQPLVLLRNY